MQPYSDVQRSRIVLVTQSDPRIAVIGTEQIGNKCSSPDSKVGKFIAVSRTFYLMDCSRLLSLQLHCCLVLLYSQLLLLVLLGNCIVYFIS